MSWAWWSGAPEAATDVIGPINADLAVTEQNDTCSATATLDLLSSVAVTEGNDVASAAGTVDIVGSVAVVEAGDTLTATTVLDIIATAAITEGDDVPSAAGTIDIVGSASVVEGDDTIASTATVEIIAVTAIAEGDDTLQASALMPIFYPRRGGVDEGQEYERWSREWREDLRRIIDRSFLVAAGIIDPITLRPIPLPDYAPLTEALVGEARALDVGRLEAFRAERRRAQEDDAMAILLLAA